MRNDKTKFKHISVEQSVASYMVGLHRRRIDVAELNNWSCFLERYFSQINEKAIVDKDIEDLSREAREEIFNVDGGVIDLADNIGEAYLIFNILPDMDRRVVLKLRELAASFKNEMQIRPACAPHIYDPEREQILSGLHLRSSSDEIKR